MESLLLSVHVLAGILFVGPVAVSTSLFPRYAPVAGVPERDNPDIAAVVVAMVLTAIAGGLLALQIAPRQREALDSPADTSVLRQLGMLAGIFNLLWTIVVVLMIVRPGSHLA